MHKRIVVIVEDGSIREIVASEEGMALVLIDLDLDRLRISTHTAHLPPHGKTIDDVINEYTEKE